MWRGRGRGAVTELRNVVSRNKTTKDSKWSKLYCGLEGAEEKRYCHKLSYKATQITLLLPPKGATAGARTRDQRISGHEPCPRGMHPPCYRGQCGCVHGGARRGNQILVCTNELCCCKKEWQPSKTCDWQHIWSARHLTASTTPRRDITSPGNLKQLFTYCCWWYKLLSFSVFLFYESNIIHSSNNHKI